MQCASSSFLAFARFYSTKHQNLSLFKPRHCCVKAIHALNAVLWHPGEFKRAYHSLFRFTCHKQTNKPTDYYTHGRPCAPRVITCSISYSIYNGHCKENEESSRYHKTHCIGKEVEIKEYSKTILASSFLATVI